MSESVNKISGLIIKYLQNKLSAEEFEDLKAWRESSAENEALFLELNDRQKLVEDLKIQEDSKKRVWAQLKASIPDLDNTRTLTVRWGRYAAAAGLIFLFVGGYYFYSTKKPDKQSVVIDRKTPSHPVADILPPSGSRTSLTLANGRQIYLDSVGSGKLVQQGNANISKLNNGQIVYNTLNEKPTEILYNTLTTAKGGQTRMVLADGSKVWLDAASSIRFPAVFTGTERKVELTGEAYFEIAHRSEPFIVETNRGSVKVLGTHFNVMAYQNEDNMETTLLEGKVMVSAGGNSSLLKPGQVAAISSSGRVKVGIADTAAAVAWKNGRFQFDKTNLDVILKQLERWYDVTVDYEDGIPPIRLSGGLSRNIKLSDVVKLMELNGARLKVDGNKITVLK
jgi:transmembrane sensor